MADNAALDQIITDQINSYMADPGDNLPQDFLSWLPQFLTLNPPQLQNSDLQNGTLTPVDNASHSINFGTGSLRFTASALSDVDQQVHGLGGIPGVVLVSSAEPGVTVSADAIGDLISARGAALVSTTAVVKYYWLAIS